MAELQLAEKGVELRGRGVLVAYDVPCNRVREGRGLQPSGFHYTMRKILDTGKVYPLQRSVLLVEDASILPALLSLLERYGASVVVVEGSYTMLLPER